MRSVEERLAGIERRPERPQARLGAHRRGRPRRLLGRHPGAARHPGRVRRDGLRRLLGADGLQHRLRVRAGAGGAVRRGAPRAPPGARAWSSSCSPRPPARSADTGAVLIARALRAGARRGGRGRRRDRAARARDAGRTRRRRDSGVPPGSPGSRSGRRSAACSPSSCPGSRSSTCRSRCWRCCRSRCAFRAPRSAARGGGSSRSPRSRWRCSPRASPARSSCSS